jgi:hypothetical protein
LLPNEARGKMIDFFCKNIFKFSFSFFGKNTESKRDFFFPCSGWKKQQQREKGEKTNQFLVLEIGEKVENKKSE